MQSAHLDRSDFRVALHVRAWVEIYNNLCMLRLSLPVALHVRAWVEIRYPF